MIFSGLFVSLAFAVSVTADATRAEQGLGSKLPAYMRSFDQDLTSSLYRRGQCYGKPCPDPATRESSDQLLSGQQHGSSSLQTNSSKVKDRAKNKGKTPANEEQPSISLSSQRVPTLQYLSRTTIRRPAANRSSGNPGDNPQVLEDNASHMRGRHSKDKSSNKCRQVLSRVKDFSKDTVRVGCGHPIF